MTSPLPANTASPREVQNRDPAREPLSGPRRFWLLTILLILPVIAVTLPAIFVTLFFPQGVHLRADSGATSAAADVSGLRNSLERNAQSMLPAPAALAAEPVVITVRADHLEARATRVKALAATYGGTVSDGLPKAGEKDLYVDVPVTSAGAFRAAVTAAAAPADPAASSGPAQPSSPPPGKAAPTEQVEVIIRAAADDQ